MKQDILVGGVTFTQTFGYDKLNRLSCVKEGSLSTPTWKQEFEYDPYGNRWIPPGGNTLPYTDSITATVAADFDTSTNRLITQPIGGLANYDGTGNLKRLAGGPGASGPGTHDLSYDGENRIYESNRFGEITSYVYDGFGRRVKRSGTVPAYFAYDVSGNLLMEESADVESTGVSYVTQDHLGSTRVVTDKDGNVVRRYDYAPFGEDLKLAGGRTVAQKYSGSDAEMKDKIRFTGKERDGETGLDYFGARCMASPQGRFTSPDGPLVDQHATDPQSWNLYGYVRNNPLRLVDEDGFKVNEAAVVRAREQIKATVAAGGSTMTFVFLGINSGESRYASTATARSISEFSGMYGLGSLDTSATGNTAILPNENFILNAALGQNAVDQLDTANAIAPLARDAGITNINMITHSNGVNSGGMFAAQNQLGTSVVIAPNTGSTTTMSNIVKNSQQTTIISSPRDNRLALAPQASKPPSVWQKIFGGNPKVTVVQTNQRGHGAQCYSAEVQGRDSTTVSGCK